MKIALPSSFVRLFAVVVAAAPLAAVMGGIHGW